MPEWGNDTRRGLGRRKFLAATLGAVAIEAARAKGDQTIDQKSLREAALDFVRKETPETSWPFAEASRDALKASPRKVFIDYFPPFPLAFSNEGSAPSLYEQQFLNPKGQNARFESVGGYIRERPLPVPSWPNGDWQSYDLAVDVVRAWKVGADAFMFDMLRLPGNPAWVKMQKAYEVVSNIGLDFYIVPEPDSGGLKDVRAADVAAALSTLGRYPGAFRLDDGRMLVAPFAPERYSIDWWRELSAALEEAGNPVALLPVFLTPVKSVGIFHPISYGMSWWGIRDFESVGHNADDMAQRAVSEGGTPFMQPVAPQDVRPKVGRYAEAGNTRLFRSLWMEAISNRASYVHMITWNDFSESTEIEPSTGIQFLFYDLSAYFISWFKLGTPPKILRDSIYYCHRRQLIDSSEPAQKDYQLVGSSPVSNEIEMIAFLTAPATLEVTIANSTYRRYVNRGLRTIHVPAAVGRPIFRIIRDSKVIVESTSDSEIVAMKVPIDPLYIGGSSTRATTAAPSSTSPKLDSDRNGAATDPK